MKIEQITYKAFYDYECNLGKYRTIQSCLQF